MEKLADHGSEERRRPWRCPGRSFYGATRAPFWVGVRGRRARRLAGAVVARRHLAAVSSRTLTIVTRFGQEWTEGRLKSDMAYSGTNFAVGSGSRSCLASSAGVMIAVVPALGMGVRAVPHLALRTPRVALVPLILIWFASGCGPRCSSCSSMRFFPVLINTIGGVRPSTPTLLRAARSSVLRTGRSSRRSDSRSVPFILTGVKQAVSLGSSASW